MAAVCQLLHQRCGTGRRPRSLGRGQRLALAHHRQIARRYLLPRQLQANGLTAAQCTLSDAVLDAISGRLILTGQLGEVMKESAQAALSLVKSRTGALGGPSDLAMTGEISLRGLVMPIGGVKEKVLAALRAGIPNVLLPARNRRDLEDIPADALAQLRIDWMETVDDALRVALEPAVVAPAAELQA